VASLNRGGTFVNRGGAGVNKCVASLDRGGTCVNRGGAGVNKCVASLDRVGTCFGLIWPIHGHASAVALLLGGTQHFSESLRMSAFH
jgi:hypothetical protein